MTELSRRYTEVVVLEQTPEQTADGILDALGFVPGLADARGMFDVGDLILQAMQNVDVWRSSESPTVARRPQADVPLVKPQLISESELDALFDALDAMPHYEDRIKRLLDSMHSSAWSIYSDGEEIESGYKPDRVYRYRRPSQWLIVEIEAQTSRKGFLGRYHQGSKAL